MAVWRAGYGERSGNGSRIVADGKDDACLTGDCYRKGSGMKIGKWLLGACLAMTLATTAPHAQAQDPILGIKNPATVEGLMQACHTMVIVLSKNPDDLQTLPDANIAGMQTGYCMGYLGAYRSIAMSVRSASAVKLACIPKNVSIIEMAKALSDAFTVFPKWKDALADGFVFAAFEAKWPCPKENTQ